LDDVSISIDQRGCIVVVEVEKPIGMEPNDVDEADLTN
jgi:hypothetical protein